MLATTPMLVPPWPRRQSITKWARSSGNIGLQQFGIGTVRPLLFAGLFLQQRLAEGQFGAGQRAHVWRREIATHIGTQAGFQSRTQLLGAALPLRGLASVAIECTPHLCNVFPAADGQRAIGVIRLPP